MKKIRAEFEKAGLPYIARHIQADGVFHDHESDTGAAWYVCNVFPVNGKINLYASGGDWKIPGKEMLNFSEAAENLTEAETQELSEKVTQLQKERTEAKKATQNNTAKLAKKTWEELPTDFTSTPYTARKQLGNHAFGARNLNETSGRTQVVIPLQNIEGEIRNLQTISPALKDNKRFLSGGEKSGCFHVLDGSLETAKICYLGEGFATMASIALATVDVPGRVVICAFDCHNLLKVTKVLRDRYPNLRIMITADNDHSGLEAAARCAREWGVEVTYPSLLPGSTGTDFNDLMCEQGLDEVRRQLEEKRPLPGVVRQDTALSGVRERSTKALYFQSLAEVFAKPEEQVPYLVEGMLISGGTSILGAKPKAGKTTLCRQLALSVARGEPFLGFRTAKGPVLYLALEEKESEVKKHFKAMGALGDEPIYIYAASAPQAVLQELRAFVEVYKPMLVITDTLFRAARVKDSNSYSEVTNALEAISDLARETGAHMMCVHHMSKVERDDADGILGSTAITGAFDSILMMNRKKDVRSLKTIQRYGQDMEETALSFDERTRRISLGQTTKENDSQEIARDLLDFSRECGPSFKIDDLKGFPVTRQKKLTALHNLVRSGHLLLSGKGGRGSPYVYSLNPNAPDGGQATLETMASVLTTSDLI